MQDTTNYLEPNDLSSILRHFWAALPHRVAEYGYSLITLYHLTVDSIWH